MYRSSPEVQVSFSSVQMLLPPPEYQRLQQLLQQSGGNSFSLKLTGEKGLVYWRYAGDTGRCDRRYARDIGVAHGTQLIQACEAVHM